MSKTQYIHIPDAEFRKAVIIHEGMTKIASRAIALAEMFIVERSVPLLLQDPERYYRRMRSVNRLRRQLKKAEKGLKIR